MKINTMQINSRVRAIMNFLRFKLIELQKIIKSAIRLGFFSPLIKVWFFSWLNYTFLYPTLRIVLGREKSFQIYNSFFKKKLRRKIFSLPAPLKSRVLIEEISDYYVLAEICLEDVYRKDIIKNGMNIVDIGAHIGAYTILAAEKVGNAGKVIAIEPESKTYKRLIENIEINGFQNIMPIKMALFDRSGLEKLYISPVSGQNSLKYRPLFHPENGAFAEVQVDTLDKLLERLNFKKIDIIKIDTEGTEMPILTGAKETLKNNPNVKIIVASYHYPSEIEEVQTFLRNMGFKTKVSPFNIVMTI